MRKTVALLLLLCACHTRVDTAASETTEIRASGETDTVTHVTKEPGKTITTVEEFGLPPAAEAGHDVAAPHDGAAADQHPANDVSGQVHAPTVRRQPVLVKRTVTVEEHGATITDTHQEQRAQATETVVAKSEGHSDTKPALSCAFGGAIWGLVALGVLGVIAWRAWKLWRAPF